MSRTATTWQPEFIFGIGDNFYQWGVTSVTDRMWINTFENVYSSNELQCDWHLTTGNHDWEGNTTAQFAYSEMSYRWTYPDYQYLIQSVKSNYIFKGSKGSNRGFTGSRFKYCRPDFAIM